MSHQLISFSNLATLAVGFATPYVIARIWRHFGLFRQELSGIRRDVNNDPAKMSTPAIVPTGMKDYALWNTALFFPCPRGDDPDSSINKLLFYLRQAENSIKLCVMTLTYGPVYELLIQKHQQGIQVLVFTSFSTATGKGKRLGAKGKFTRKVHFASLEDGARFGSDFRSFLGINYCLIDPLQGFQWKVV